MTARESYARCRGFARAMFRVSTRLCALIDQGFRTPFRDCELHALEARARFAHDRLPPVARAAVRRPEVQ
jgi:hypothetical protein